MSILGNYSLSCFQAEMLIPNSDSFIKITRRTLKPLKPVHFNLDLEQMHSTDNSESF